MLYLLSYGHHARMGFYQRKYAWQSAVCTWILCDPRSGRTVAPKYANLCLVLAVDSRFRGNDGGGKGQAVAWRLWVWGCGRSG
jgi:hypothetical protein